METPWDTNPQNPYNSYLVAASAGCGKTYQLSQRFLCLVAAGADPAQILTVTYTRKAVAEMRERIVGDAMKLAVDAPSQVDFDQRVQVFFISATAAARADGRQPPPPPRSARETAEVILAATQTIKIATIDSIFYEWSNKFGDELLGESEYLPTPVDMVGALERQRLDQHTDQATYLKFLGQTALRLEDLPDLSFEAAMTQAKNLNHHDTYVWACGEGQALLRHPVDQSIPEGEASCIQGISSDLRAIIASISNPDVKDACLAALAMQSLDRLSGAGLLTKDFAVSKGKIKGKTRDGLAAEIIRVEGALAAFKNAQKIRHLNRQGDVLFQLRSMMQEARRAHKQQRRLAEFSDLTKVAYRLFASERAAGTRYLIQRHVRHLLLDEFQDTSRSQWFVFHSIAEELLAGEGLESPFLESEVLEHPDADPRVAKDRVSAAHAPYNRGTIFLVGDEKQSIYGYREADPEVLEDAAVQLAPLGLKLAPLNASYRSAQLALDFVNEVFSHEQSYMNNFPPHETARRRDLPVVPNVARIKVQDPVLPDPARPEVDADEIEAELLAAHLRDVLSGTIPTPVWDKGRATFRAIRPGDCAILYRTKGKTHLIEDALRKVNIPFIREEAQGFFARPEIQDAAKLIEFLAKPSDLAALCGVLRAPFGGVSNAALQAVLIETYALTQLPERTAVILQHLDRQGCGVARALRATLSAAGSNDTPACHAVFRQIMRATNAVHAYKQAYPAPDDELAAANLSRFVEILVDLETKGYRTFAVQSRALGELAAINETGTSTPISNAVRLMTVHKSKGLEFPFVALTDTAKDWLGSERYWLRGNDEQGRPGIYYVGRAGDRPKGDATFAAIQTRLTELNHAEMRRLLYVALTRAKQYLYISGSMSDPTNLDQTYLGLLLTAAARMPRLETENLADHPLAPCPLADTEGSTPMGLLAATPEWAPGAAAIVPAELRVASPSRHPGPVILSEAKDLAQRGSSPAAQNDGKQPPTHPPERSEGPRFDREAARIHGLMVHAILEVSASGSARWESAAWQKMKWRELCQTLPPTHELRRSHEEARVRALDEARAVLLSAAWQGLMDDAAVVIPEAPLALLQSQGRELILGRADLVVQKRDGTIWVVDYKSSEVETQDLRAFATSQGFDQQVASYCTALRAASSHSPGIKITGALLFTASSTLLALN